MHRFDRFSAAILAALAVLPAGAGPGQADGIQPGLWRITGRTQTGGVIGPPHESSKCLSPQEASDVATAFTPIPRTVNSECGPIERKLEGPLLNWRLVCKGQLNMELTGEFDFDTPRHYTGKVNTKAEMAGMPMVDSQDTIEGQWVSDCPQ